MKHGPQECPDLRKHGQQGRKKTLAQFCRWDELLYKVINFTVCICAFFWKINRCCITTQLQPLRKGLEFCMEKIHFLWSSKEAQILKSLNFFLYHLGCSTCMASLSNEKTCEWRALAILMVLLCPRQKHICCSLLMSGKDPSPQKEKRQRVN